jgi:hypothetical protein
LGLSFFDASIITCCRDFCGSCYIDEMLAMVEQQLDLEDVKL